LKLKDYPLVGCKYIQIDEPLFARKPIEANDYGIEQLERCFHGIENKIEKIAHICCGYPDRLDAIDYPKAPLRSYFDISKNIDESIIDTVSIEDAHRHNDLKLLELFKKTNVIFGLVKIASSKVESVNEIDYRIKKALNHIDKKRLIAAPDCGLGHLKKYMVLEKLRNLVEAAKRN